MHASYLNKVFNRKEQDHTIREIKRILKEKNIVFDGFIVTGVSGIAMGSIVARAMRKDLVIVRKPKDGTHSSYNVENYKSNKKYIFLDDLIASGATLDRVKESLIECGNRAWLYGKLNKKNTSKLIGGIFYDGMFRTTGEGINYLNLAKLNKASNK